MQQDFSAAMRKERPPAKLAQFAKDLKEGVDGIKDNVLGKMNPAAPAGNHVVIDHGSVQYSLLAHFSPWHGHRSPGRTGQGR